jgi:DNA-binding PadR family transcriptional regulator
MPRVSLVHTHILLALADGERHGYGIKQDVERQTDSAVRLGPGTLYEAIQRLEATGLIEESSGNRQPTDRARRYYRLTRQGWAALRKEIEGLQRLLDQAQSNSKLRRTGSG